MAFKFYGWAVAIPQHLDGYEVIKLMTRAPSSWPSIKAISDRNLRIRRDLQFTGQELQTHNDPTAGAEEVLLVGFTVADLPDAAKKSVSRKRGTAVGTVVAPDRTIAVHDDNRLIMVVTPIRGLDGQMKFYGLVDQQDQDGLCTPQIMDQESCFYLPIFRGGVESASIREVKKQWNKNIRDIVGGGSEVSPDVTGSASATADDGGERQVSPEATESPKDSEGQASPDAAASVRNDERQVSPELSTRSSRTQSRLRPDHPQWQVQKLTAQLMPLLHDVIGVEQTLKEVITAADEAVTSSMEEVAPGNGEVDPHSEEEIRERSVSTLLAGGFDKMYRDLVWMTELKRLRGDQRVVNAIRQIVDTTLTPLVSRLREMERLMAPEENVDSEHGDSDDGVNDDVDEGNDDSTDGTLANNRDSNGSPDGSQTDGESDSRSDTSEWSGIHDSEDDVEMREDEEMEDDAEMEDHQEMDGDEEVEEDQDVEGDNDTEDEEETEDNEEMRNQEVEVEEMDGDVDLVHTWNESIRSNHSPDQGHNDASSLISAEGATDVANEINEDGSLCHSVSSPVLGEGLVSIAAMADRVADNDNDDGDEELGKYWEERAREVQVEEAEGKLRRSLRFPKRSA
ncbi:hypothetical protein N0V85_005800 [Neurospora sp. IMI 360204]|nr:hypothetical protein N0V85_005800 [Neurospora sp. IMI 360204]